MMSLGFASDAARVEEAISIVSGRTDSVDSSKRNLSIHGNAQYVARRWRDRVAQGIDLAVTVEWCL